MKTFFSADRTRSRTIDASRVVRRRERADAGNGLYLGHDAHGWHYAGPQHSVLVLGPPRSGKTSSLLIPNVLSAPTAPVVTTSTKPDVLDATRRHALVGSARATSSTPRARSPTARASTGCGGRRSRRAPRGGPHSTTARSLVVVGSVGTRRRAGRGIHWTERAQALLAPLLHAAALEGADMRTVLGWVDRRRALPAQQTLSAVAATRPSPGTCSTASSPPTSASSAASGRRRRAPSGGFRSERGAGRHCDPDFDPSRLRRARATPSTSPPRRTTRRWWPRSWSGCSTTSAAPPTTGPPTDRIRSGPAGAAGPRRAGQHRPAPRAPVHGQRGRRPGRGDAGLLPGPVPGPAPVARTGRRLPLPVRHHGGASRHRRRPHPRGPVGPVRRPRARGPVGVAGPDAVRPSARPTCSGADGPRRASSWPPSGGGGWPRTRSPGAPRARPGVRPAATSRRGSRSPRPTRPSRGGACGDSAGPRTLDGPHGRCRRTRGRGTRR